MKEKLKILEIQNNNTLEEKQKKLYYDENNLIELKNLDDKEKLEKIEELYKNLSNSENIENFGEIAVKLLDKKNKHGQNFLHLALENNNINVFKILIESISDQEQKDQFLFTQDNLNYHTVLHLAALYNNPKSVAIILDNISTERLNDLIESSSEYGVTPLDLAIFSNSIEVIKLIFNKIDHDKKFSLIIKQDTEGSTLLHKAAQYNALEIFKLLLDNINDRKQIPSILETKNKYNSTALSIASAKKHKRMEDYIKKIKDEFTNKENEANYISPIQTNKWIGKVALFKQDDLPPLEYRPFTIGGDLWKDKVIKTNEETIVKAFKIKLENNKDYYIIMKFKLEDYKNFGKLLETQSLPQLSDLEKFGQIVYRDNDPISDELFEDIKKQVLKEDLFLLH